MSTRATIKFSDGNDEYFIYRHHDGYPDGDIIPDLEKTILKTKGRWSDPDVGMMTTAFLCMNNDFEKERIPSYEITPCFHGDESYIYHLTWNEKTDKWECGMLKKADFEEFRPF